MSAMNYYADLRVRRSWTLAASAGLITLVAYVVLKGPPEERATISSPRTGWSSKSTNQSKRWFAFERTLVGEARAYRTGTSSRLLLLGDSITESWKGTSYGQPSRRTDGVPAVLNETLAKRWGPAPLVLAISGDQTQHVLWRVAHGEISTAMAADPKLLISLLIGTNNLGHGHLPDEAAAGVQAVASELLGRTAGKLLINALLPRGDGKETLPTLCPPRCNGEGKPFASFMPAVVKVNALLEKATDELAKQWPGRVAFVDCGTAFSTSGDEAHRTPFALLPFSRLLPRC